MQGWFGFTSTHLNIWLQFGHRILFKVLHGNEDAAVRFPTDEGLELQIQIIEALGRVYLMMDGLKLKFESCESLMEQSMYYNGWQHGHFITNLFVFSACGRIIACVLNVPGCVHDSTLATWGGVYQKLEETYD